MHEDFTRCECSHALIEKKEYLTAEYSSNYRTGKLFVPKSKITEYICHNCKKLIHSTTTKED
jgi:DNA-directed RNA polymerase subunit RPC12/RpoP